MERSVAAVSLVTGLGQTANPLVVATRRPVALAIGALVFVGCSLQDGAGGGRGVGDSLPQLGLAGRHPALVWVFDARECLGCKLTDPARTVRAAQRQLGEHVELVAVAVGENGETDHELVAGFLRSQRVSARIEVRSRAEYVRAFGRADTGLFYVVDGSGVIKAVLAADDAADWRSPGDSLDLAGFVRVLERTGPERVDDGGLNCKPNHNCNAKEEAR